MIRANQISAVKALPCLILLCMAGLSACSGAPRSATADHELAAYAWLLGDWRADAGENFLHETWRMQGSRSFAGAGSTENRENGERKGFEQLELLSRDGKVFFIATVAHNPAPVPFALSGNDPERLVFANAEHDFPKKIVYKRVDHNHMRVEVSDGGSNGFALDFERITGESQGAAAGN